MNLMIDELNEPVSDIDVLVNSVANAGENWELDSHSWIFEIGHLSSFILSLLFIPAMPILYERSL